MQKKFDNIPDEVKRRNEQELITLVGELTDKEIGVIAAQEITDAVLEHYGPEIYRVALKDAKSVVEEKLADIEYGIDSLHA